jgi:hypothetical protein
MKIRHVHEKPDGSVVFQGVLEGPELAFVIEMGLDALIEAGVVPFAAIESYEAHDFHQPPEGKQ